MDQYRESIKIMIKGIGIEKIKARQDELQSALGKNIEAIRALKNPQYAQIILSTRVLPRRCNFSDFANLERDASFLVGESKAGAITADISKLPHALIAGHTGGGKSQFFKQLLVSLLKSTNHLQMHLIDLKGGLEFREFKTLSNVTVAKTLDESVSILYQIEKQMHERFNYLENQGLLQVEPQKHPFDRIVVGIDEASVLFAQARRDSEDYDLICKARELAESISKLGRAAAIHLVLATQKLAKESIDTRIQENIAGRMCFKTGTPEGSFRVLGNTHASHLPSIPGRGIWQFGSEEVQVQAPYLSTQEMKSILQGIKAQYENGEKTLKQAPQEQKNPAGNFLLSCITKKSNDDEVSSEAR